MKTMKVKLKDLKENPNNPRTINEDKFDKLVKSIKEFPKMLELRPIIVNDDMVVLGGNMRLKACKKLKLKEVSVIKASELTAEQQQEFIIKDNVGFGLWNWDLLANEWDSVKLNDWGLEVWENQDDLVQKLNEQDEWIGMPEFEAKDNSYRIMIHFNNEEDRELYAKTNNMKFVKKETQCWSTWHPYQERDDLISLEYDEK